MLRNLKTIFLLFSLLSCSLPVKSQTIIPGGYVSGIWDSAHSPYIVEDDILIHPDSTLAITEGTFILFSGPYVLEVQGQLLVNGTPSQPVIFDRENDTITWRGVFFNTTDTSITDSSIMEHGLISNCYQNACLNITSCSRLRVSDFTIHSGNSFRGGGIRCSFSNPFFENLIVQNNVALDGAGISLEQSNPLLKNCIITQNSADGTGGGIVIFNLSAPLFENCTISGNQSYGSGGGIYINDANPVFVRCSISGNEGAIGGSNLYSGGGVSVKLGSHPYFENCTFENNISHREGGAIASFSPSELINCLFVGNTAATFGGGAYLASGNLIISHLSNCTFSNNDSPQGTALATHNHTALLRNCILWHSAPANPGSLIHLDAIFVLNVLNAGYSDIQNGQAGIELSGNAQFIWVVGNIDLDPEFIPGSRELSWLSPCIEAGTSDTSGLMLPETDLAENPRLTNQRVDMGAYEYQFPVIIQNSKFKIQNYLKVYPNPAREWVYVEMDKNQAEGTIRLINPEGLILMQEILPAGKQLIKIDLKGYPAGIYIISFNTAGFEYFDKLIIKS